MKLSESNITILNDHITNGNIRVAKHPDYELYLYKYTQQCVFNGIWDDVTLMCRGLVLDNEYNIIANCIPKFFNYEELNQVRVPNINLNQAFTITRKDDGSLIQIFMYKNNLITTSSGGFCNDYTKKAEELLSTKYKHIIPIITDSPDLNFIFEMISPLTKVVINYEDTEELRLITIRDMDGLEFSRFIEWCKTQGFDYVQEEKFYSIVQLLVEKVSEFKNIEGYVIKFEDGQRVKFKYDEYFTLHKTIAHVSKKFVWEALANNIDLNLENIPDETFKQIKQWKKELEDEFNFIEDAVVKANRRVSIASINGVFNRKQQAEFILKNYKEYSQMLFAMLDDRDIEPMIWKKIKPSNED